MIDANLIERDFIICISDCYIGIIKKYIIAPFIEGIIGLFLFLSLNFFIKVFGWITNISGTIQFSTSDISLSLSGFLILFLIKLSVNYWKDTDETDSVIEHTLFEN